MSQPVEAIGHSENFVSRDTLINTIKAKKTIGLSLAAHWKNVPQIMPWRGNEVNTNSAFTSKGSYTSPEGVRIIDHSESAGVTVRLLSPVGGMVTTYEGDRGLHDEVLQLAKILGVNAGDYIRSKPVTIPKDTNGTSPEEWHQSNMDARKDEQIFFIDAYGRTRKILHSRIEHTGFTTGDEMKYPVGTGWVSINGQYYRDEGEMTDKDLAFYDAAYSAYQDALKPQGISARTLLVSFAYRKSALPKN